MPLECGASVDESCRPVAISLPGTALPSGRSLRIAAAVRLVHQVFLLLLVVVLVAVLAMGGFFAVNLHRDFLAYINAERLARLDALALLVADEARRVGGLEHLRHDRRAWITMLRQVSADPTPEHAAMPAPATGSAVQPTATDEPAPAAAPEPGARERRRATLPPDGLPLRFALRVDLIAADGRSLAPFPIPRRPESTRPYERAVSLDGQKIATLRMWPIETASQPVEEAFLRSQFGKIALVAGALVALALALAPWVARRVTRPLEAVRAATERIARGEFDVRLPEGRRDEIGALIRNVNHMGESLSRLEESRRRWIAEIAHELRTPITVLQGELDALHEGVRPTSVAAIASLREETQSLAKLVGDLHQLAVAEMNALSVTLAPTDLAGVLRSAAERRRGPVEAGGLTLELDLPALPVSVSADPQRLLQLFGNLIDNSVRYTDPPGQIRISLHACESAAVVEIEDTPPGIPPADYSRVFDPLYRADPSRSRAAGGTGLGLAICRSIVVVHGGTIAAFRPALGGLGIRITLPRL